VSHLFGWTSPQSGWTSATLASFQTQIILKNKINVFQSLLKPYSINVKGTDRNCKMEITPLYTSQEAPKHHAKIK